MLLEAARSQLLVVDVQEKLLPAVEDAAGVVQNCIRLATAATHLGVPVTVSEQNPRGLGPTSPDVAVAASGAAILPKMTFSCAGEPAILERLAGGRRQLVVAGVEAHICVLQSALALADQGYDVFVVADATASRRPASKAAALSRLGQAGVALVTTEMVIFEWLERAGTPAFKAMLPLVK